MSLFMSLFISMSMTRLMFMSMSMTMFASTSTSTFICPCLFSCLCANLLGYSPCSELSMSIVYFHVYIHACMYTFTVRACTVHEYDHGHGHEHGHGNEHARAQDIHVTKRSNLHDCKGNKCCNFPVLISLLNYSSIDISFKIP
jgi:hypothetical protein